MEKNRINYKKLGKRIKETCIAKGISTKELAEALDITEDTLLSIYSGSDHPSLTLLVSLADALDAPIDYLLVDSLSNCSYAIDYMISTIFDEKNTARNKALLRYADELLLLFNSKEKL